MSQINYKITLIGNSGVGKTSLFKKLYTGIFHEKNISTIGVEKTTMDVTIDTENKDGKKEKKSFSISLFDTAGQEKFKSITFNYFKGSDGILLIYDITSRQTFDQISYWIDNIKEAIDSKENSKYTIILIGNKLDLIDEANFKRQVTEEEAMDTCEKYDLFWGGEHSTKKIELEDLNKLFGEYVGEIYKKVGEKVNKKQKFIKVDNYKKKKKGCFGFFY